MKTLFFLAFVHILCAGNTNAFHVNNHSDLSVINVAQKHYADTVSLKGSWYLQPMLASDTATGKIPELHINLAAQTFTGNTGCNTMRGSFQKSDSSLVFNQNIVTTKMFCSGYDEAAFVRSLLRTNRYRFENDVLVLMFDATELSRWTRKPGKQLKINKA